MISSDLKEIAERFPVYTKEVSKHYRWNFIIVMLDSSFFSFALAFLSVDTILPYFISNLTNQRVWVGVIASLYFWGFYFPQIIGAHLVQASPMRKWAIFWIAIAERAGILTIAILAGSIHLFSKSQMLILFVLAYAIFAVTNGLIGPAYADFISKTINRNRGQFYGAMSGLGGLIGFGASLLASYFLDRFAFPINVQVLFWICFASSFISPLLILNFKEVPYPVERKQETFAEFIRKIPLLIRQNAAFGRYLLIRSFIGLCLMANSFYTLYAVKRFSLSDGAVGIFTMVILLTQSGLGFIWGRLGDRVGFKRVYILAIGLVGLQGFLALAFNAVWVYYIVMFGIGGVYAALRTSDANMVFEIVPPEETSRFIGISNTLLSPVMAAAPLIGGLLVDNFSYAALFSVNLSVAFISLILTIRWLPDPKRYLTV